MAKECSSNPEKLLTVKEALWTLGISRTTLWRQLHDHQIECVRIGSRVLFEPKAIDAFIARHRQLQQVATQAKGIETNKAELTIYPGAPHQTPRSK